MKIDPTLLNIVEIDPRWYEGPFYSLKMLPAKTKGSRFEQITHAILENRGHKVLKSPTTEYDRIIDDERYEIKGSTITKSTNNKFSFLQIRPNQDYDHLLLVSFWFDGTVKMYTVPKQDTLLMVSNGLFKKQHGGNKSDSGTFYYNGNLDIFEKYFWFSEKIIV